MKAQFHRGKLNQRQSALYYPGFLSRNCSSPLKVDSETVFVQAFLPASKNAFRLFPGIETDELWPRHIARRASQEQFIFRIGPSSILLYDMAFSSVSCQVPTIWFGRGQRAMPIRYSGEVPRINLVGFVPFHKVTKCGAKPWKVGQKPPGLNRAKGRFVCG